MKVIDADKINKLKGKIEELSILRVRDYEIEIKLDKARWIGNGSGCINIINNSIRFYIEKDIKSQKGFIMNDDLFKLQRKITDKEREIIVEQGEYIDLLFDQSDAKKVYLKTVLLSCVAFIILIKIAQVMDISIVVIIPILIIGIINIYKQCYKTLSQNAINYTATNELYGVDCKVLNKDFDYTKHGLVISMISDNDHRKEAENYCYTCVTIVCNDGKEYIIPCTRTTYEMTAKNDKGIIVLFPKKMELGNKIFYNLYEEN